MVKRSVALCEGKYIGIESIYTVIDGSQINIPDRLNALRIKSKQNQLFCPCGCSANLILVAGDKNLKEQHFRIKTDSESEKECNYIPEREASVISKIVLKCWLDVKLRTDDLEMRVPINLVRDTDRKYEISFLSKKKNIAVDYCYDRMNLSDEKISLLHRYCYGKHIFHIVDASNGGLFNQFPEWMMKIQQKQNYCLFLSVEDTDYTKALLKGVFYAKNFSGLWEEHTFCEGRLRDFSFDQDGNLIFIFNKIDDLYSQEKEKWMAQIVEERRFYKEKEEIRKQKEEEERRKKEELERRRVEKLEAERMEAMRIAEENRRRDLDFQKNIDEGFLQQENEVWDANGVRWIKCEFCGKIAKADDFTTYGGVGRINLGTCYDCDKNNPEVKKKYENMLKANREAYDPNKCPKCGGQLVERTGKYGAFMGCRNYPKCRFTRPVKKEKG